MDLTKYIRVIPDFPKKGISFKDITPLLENAQAYHYAIDKLAKPFQNKKIQKVCFLVNLLLLIFEEKKVIIYPAGA